MNKQTSSFRPETAITNLPPAPSGILQRKCACGNHTIAGGECAKDKNNLQRKADSQNALGAGPSLSHGSVLQAKLTIGASDNPLEQEADRVADQVLAAPAHSAVRGAPLHIQRYTEQATKEADTAPASVDHVLASNDSAGRERTLTAAGNGRVRDISVSLDITRTYIGDLIVTLTPPGAAGVALHERSGGSADNLIKTYTTATTSALAALRGTALQGAWRLRVADVEAKAVGKLNRWALRIERGA